MPQSPVKEERTSKGCLVMARCGHRTQLHSGPGPTEPTFGGLSRLSGNLLQTSRWPTGAECLGPLLPLSIWLISSQFGQSRASHQLSQEPPPGSPPGGKMLPGPRPRANHGGEGEGGQEGEETKVEQAFNAVIADASEGVQVVLEGGTHSWRRVGHSLGSELIPGSPSPSAWTWIFLPSHPKHLVQP